MTLTPNFSRRRVYWLSQETTSDGALDSTTNTAGSFDLATDGVITCARAVRGQTLIWTTTDVWAMSYIGGVLIYSFQRAGNNCGIIAPQAAVVLDTGAYWMGNGKFFHYDGFVVPLLCDVADYVFNGLNTAALGKVWTLANPKFNEVTWFYPSGSNTECDRYVTYNYVEEHWVYGAMSRGTGVTAWPGMTPAVPVLVQTTTVRDHETGNVRGTAAFLESGPMEIGDGDNTMRVQRVVPDDGTAGDVQGYLYSSLYPNGAETLSAAFTLNSPTSVRVTARQVRLRLEEVVATAWRVGMVRLGGIMGSRR